MYELKLIKAWRDQKELIVELFVLRNLILVSLHEALFANIHVVISLE